MIPVGLTKRELQIVALLAEGRTMLEIARMIGISHKAVSTRLVAARRRLGYETTAQLMFRLGRESVGGSKEG